MAKNRKGSQKQEDAFEIIELASFDLETLAKAFKLIDELCRSQDESAEDEQDDEWEGSLLH